MKSITTDLSRVTDGGLACGALGIAFVVMGKALENNFFFLIEGGLTNDFAVETGMHQINWR